MTGSNQATGEHRPVRTRFAPSPTGYLHIGGARTALFAWAYARHHNGQFVLRIEDTDLERSTPAAVQAILDGMNWLGLVPDEGPFYQTRRLARYQEVIAELLAAGKAYLCYASPDELEQMREAQRARGEKARYDGRWRPENSAGKTPPADVKPVVRFRNPDDGAVQWTDMVKGPISIANAELDDLIIARADGSPTYNFCVVVDDADMNISHVIRGDDHVNNTPRQINILDAIGAVRPVYGHVPMIHGQDGQKLSKRHGAVSVMHYAEAGYLPEATINYLARLGWSHGDDELFSREQLVGWFDGSHLSHSPSQFDDDKLGWVNQQYLKASDNQQLADWVSPRLARRLAAAGQGDALPTAALPEMCGLMKERADTLETLADDVALFVIAPDWSAPRPELSAQLAKKAVPASGAALAAFAQALAQVDWSAEAIAALVKQTVGEFELKMPQFGLPLRVVMFARAQTPAIEQMLSRMTREHAIARLEQGLAWWQEQGN